MNRLPQFVSTFWTCVVLLLGSLSLAQEKPDLPKLNIIDQLGIPGLGGAADGEKATFSAEYRLAEGSRNGRVSITATMQPTWHLYSITQLPGGPQTSVIKLASSEHAALTGEFTPNV